MLQNSADDLARTFQFRHAKSTDEPKLSNVHYNHRILMVRIQALKSYPSHAYEVYFAWAAETNVAVIQLPSLEGFLPLGNPL